MLFEIIIIARALKKFYNHPIKSTYSFFWINSVFTILKILVYIKKQ